MRKLPELTLRTARTPDCLLREDADMPHRFDAISLDQLRNRRSTKWRKYPPDVLPAWIAEMDFPLAEPVRQALREAIDRDDAGYAHFDGFGEAASGFLAERLKWTVDPAQVSALPDVMAGVTECLRLFTRPGDGVVINPPVYAPFFAAIADIERRVVGVPLVRDDGYRLDLDALERSFAAGARAYLLCNPHNPTGTVLGRAELETIVELARRYDVAVIADEVHAPLTLPGTAFTPYLSLGAAAGERAVALTSASKAFNLAGLKCAALVATDPDAHRLTERIPLEVRYRTGLFGVLAGIAAFEHGREWLDDVLDYLHGNGLLLQELLSARLPDVRYTPPQASYLAWLDFTAYDLGPDPAVALLERGRVALSPGPDFGRPGHGFARLNMGTSRALLAEAVDRIAHAVTG